MWSPWAVLSGIASLIAPLEFYIFDRNNVRATKLLIRHCESTKYLQNTRQSEN